MFCALFNNGWQVSKVADTIIKKSYRNKRNTELFLASSNIDERLKL